MEPTPRPARGRMKRPGQKKGDAKVKKDKLKKAAAAAEEQQERGRYKGGKEELASTLGPFVTSKNFVNYGQRLAKSRCSQQQWQRQTGCYGRCAALRNT